MEYRKVLYLVLLILGVYGGLLLFFSVPEIQCSRGLLFLAAPFPVLLLWCIDCCGGKRKICLYLFLAAAAGFLCWNFIDLLSEQIPFMFRCFAGTSFWPNKDITAGLLFFLTAYSLVLFFLEWVVRIHLLAVLLTLALTAVLPAAGVWPDTGAVFLLLSFDILFWIVREGEGTQATFSETVKAGALTLTPVLLVFFVSVHLISGSDGSVYEFAKDLDLKLKSGARQIAADFSGDSKTISRGNLSARGEKIMEIRVPVQPTETLYLKNFQGGNYRNGKWLADRDAEILEKITVQNSWKREETLFKEMYYLANWLNDMTERPIVNLRIRREQGIPLSEPYFARLTYTRMLEKSQKEEVYNYYELKDINIRWNQYDPYESVISSDLEGEGGETGLVSKEKKRHESYRKEAKKIYTQLSGMDFRQFRTLQEENPKEGVTQITSFIKQTLHEHGTYTEQPGVIPPGKDPVEYFFFESHQGYCQHFASAAVVLYRLYGIPARYATGYAVKPSEFVSAEGIYLAEVTDQAAHAWVEIFLDDQGWTPVEMTPGGGGIETVIPDSTQENPQGTFSEENENGEREGPLTIEPLGKDAARKLSRERAFRRLLPFLGLAVLFAGYLLYIKLCRQAFLRMDCRKAFGKILQFLHFAGFLQKYDGTEEDFAAAAAAAVPEISWQDVWEITERAAFGPAEPTASENETVRRAYQNLLRILYPDLPRWKKLCCIHLINSLPR